ncbi:hypothetical protein C8R43DRAFT_1133998 [Mycena crocata]|nr:hypothetical protein C8R43DRAFT_1133998 [Mycena crocata]
MSRLSYFTSQHGHLHHGERYANLDYTFLTNLLSQAVIFYDTCYQLDCSSAAMDNLDCDDLPDLEDTDGNIVPKDYRCAQKRVWPFAKL